MRVQVQAQVVSEQASGIKQLPFFLCDLALSGNHFKREQLKEIQQYEYWDLSKSLCWLRLIKKFQIIDEYDESDFFCPNE